MKQIKWLGVFLPLVIFCILASYKDDGTCFFCYDIDMKETRSRKETAAPLIKWAGGKRQLLDEIIKRMPEEFNDYYEPFIGGGAVFFSICDDITKPRRIYINDSNEELINLYRQARDNSKGLMDFLDVLQAVYNNADDKREAYYRTREEFNRCKGDSSQGLVRAGLLVFLNKSGFNGLYRVNRSGRYNVPWGQKNAIKLYDSENVNKVAEALKRSTVTCGDFADACRTAKAGDFVFFDSPYYDTFDTYQAGGFNEEAHRRLAELYTILSRRGVFCMMTNSATSFIRELYDGYKIEEVEVRRMINRNADGRTGREFIITNY